jgi:formamidopyrimidine-DNA glycosylase
MPELPEVETTVKILRQKVLGKTFVDVWSDAKKIVKKPDNFLEFKKLINGKKIKKVWRLAKNVIFELSEGYSLLIHQKMTGHLLLGKWSLRDGVWQTQKPGPLNDPYNRFLHVIFFFDDKKMMALSDVRKFAKIELQKTQDMLNSKEIKSLGPDPLSKNFSIEKFKNILKNKKRKIKQVLMDQKNISGIGNIYASESLWHAKIHPEKQASKLTPIEAERLYEFIKKVLTKSIELGGESFSDYRKPDGSRGGFDTERKAYKREGQACSRCGKKIKRIKIEQRSTFYCSFCQKI